MMIRSRRWRKLDHLPVAPPRISILPQPGLQPHFAPLQAYLETLISESERPRHHPLERIQPNNSPNVPPTAPALTARPQPPCARERKLFVEPLSGDVA